MTNGALIEFDEDSALRNCLARSEAKNNFSESFFNKYIFAYK